MTNQEIMKLLWLVKAQWRQFEIFGPDQITIQIGAWYDVLSDIDLASARAVVAKMATAEREFPPTSGQIRSEVIRLRSGSSPDADVALAEVLKAVRERGWTATMRGGVGLDWSHPAIGQAVDAVGGWGEVCSSDNPEALRAHFTKAYEQAAKRAQASAAAPPILGELMAGHNETLGLPPAARPRLAAVSPKDENAGQPGLGVPSHVADALGAARDAMRSRLDVSSADADEGQETEDAS